MFIWVVMCLKQFLIKSFDFYWRFLGCGRVETSICTYVLLTLSQQHKRASAKKKKKNAVWAPPPLFCCKKSVLLVENISEHSIRQLLQECRGSSDTPGRRLAQIDGNRIWLGVCSFFFLCLGAHFVLTCF
jgi:hypothetical protein